VPISIENTIMVILIFLIVFVLGILMMFRTKVTGKDSDYSKLKRRNNMIIIVVLLFLIALNVFNVFSRGGSAGDMVSTNPFVLGIGVLAIVFLIIGSRRKKKKK